MNMFLSDKGKTKKVLTDQEQSRNKLGHLDPALKRRTHTLTTRTAHLRLKSGVRLIVENTIRVIDVLSSGLSEDFCRFQPNFVGSRRVRPRVTARGHLSKAIYFKRQPVKALAGPGDEMQMLAGGEIGVPGARVHFATTGWQG